MQRKVFRIEQMVEAGPASQHDDAIESYQLREIAPAITHELAAIRSALERNARQLAVLINDGKDRRMTRAAGDLGARLDGESGNAGQRDIDVMFA